jgi:hypothetical protein
MAVGQGGRAVGSRGNEGRPSGSGAIIGKHIHKGSAESTQGGGPGCTSAPGASQQGSGGSSPYGRGGDGS